MRYKNHMRKTGNTKYNKMLMLIAAFMMVLLLSGCRTRITNNTEVASTISDEDGWLQESYEMRRDDLEMPVAKKPFILGSKDEELDGYDEYERDFDDFDSDFDREVEEEDIDDSDDSSNDTSSSTQTTSSSSSSTTARRNTTPVRRRTTATTRRRTTPTKKKTSTNTSKKTDPPKEEQQEQQQQEQQKKQYTVSFDGNGVDMDGATITVEEGGTYGSLPEPPSRDDATFEGWYTEEKEGTKVQEGDKLATDGDHTLYAHWTEKKDPVKEWGDRFDIAANEQVDKLDCLLLPDEKNKKTVEDCKGNSVAADGSPKCIIYFASEDEEVSDASAQTIFEENSAVNPALEKVIIIHDNSINADDDKQQLFYKLVLLDAMHGKLGQDTLDAAASDLGVTETMPVIYTRP